jgi:cellulose synthase/poly-beta-1,6-N-acetylglucosamine synthase-like glycosyltransferase
MPRHHGDDEISLFIKDLGLSDWESDAIKRRSMRHGVSFDELIIAEGLMTQTRLYRGLADYLGLPFIDGTFAIARESITALGLKAQTVALETAERGPRFAHAPTGRAFSLLLRQHQAGARQKTGLAITTPACLADNMRTAGADLIADLASRELARQTPALSASRLPLPRLITGCAALLGVGTALAFVVPDFAFALFALVMVLAIGPGIALRLIASGQPRNGEGLPDLPTHKLPRYSIVVALYREARIVPQLVAALEALRYPPAKLDIKLVIEQDDQDTALALAALVLPPYFDVVTCPPGFPRTKPRALNAALAFCSGDIVAIYDAEDIPHPDQLRDAAAVFAVGDERLACVQARLAIDNCADNWLTQVFALEYAALFDRVVPGLARLKLPIPLGGTSNHFRREILTKVVGWDAWNVTEDADLGLRLARMGYTIGHVASDTSEEAPARLPAWLRQRRRWLKGWMQTAIVHLAAPHSLIRDLGFVRASVVAAHSAGTVLTSLSAPLTLWLCGDLVWRLTKGLLILSPMEFLMRSDAAAFGIAVVGIAALVAPVQSARQERGLRLSPVMVVAVPAYLLLISLAAWMAVIDLIRSPTYWHKTEHGLARTSLRSTPPT